MGKTFAVSWYDSLSACVYLRTVSASLSPSHTVCTLYACHLRSRNKEKAAYTTALSSLRLRPLGHADRSGNVLLACIQESRDGQSPPSRS